MVGVRIGGHSSSDVSDGQRLPNPLFDSYAHLLESSSEEVISGFDAD